MGVLIVAALGLAVRGAGAQAPTVRYTSIAQDLRDREYAPVRDHLIAAAERMPEAAWQYRPVAGARTFAEEVHHAADVNLRLCGIVLGATRPPGGSGTPPAPPAGAAPAAPASGGGSPREAGLARLRMSFAVCDRALNSVTDETLVQPSGPQFLIGSRLIAMTGHISQMYGRVALILRLNGLTPPSSDP